MPVHDWTRVDAGIFHAFHHGWVGRLQDALNSGRMPDCYYALAEQHMREDEEDGRGFGPDVLTLQIDGFGGGPNDAAPDSDPDLGGVSGGVAVAQAPPKVAQRREMPRTDPYIARRRTVAVRHVSGDRLVGLVEIVSPGNKHSLREIERFVDKIDAAVRAGVHVLVVDLFPPTPRDPAGLHGLIGGRHGDRFTLDPDRPLTLAPDVADDPLVAYVQPLAVGEGLIEMPLFLDPGHYVNVPLGETYAATFDPFPAKWRAAVGAV